MNNKLVRLWRKVRAWFQPVVYVRGRILTDFEVRRALAVEVEGVLTFEAVLQLIDVLEQRCIETSIGLVPDYGALASEVGGYQVLRELRDEMIDLRAQGRADD